MLFSVIIPTWKRDKELDLILKSLSEQAFKLNIVVQVIVADSHSSDKITYICDKWKEKSNSLKIEHVHTENVLASKRNYGLKFSEGKYIIFLDDDCVPTSTFLECCMSYLPQLNKKIVFCGEVRFLPEQINSSNYYRYRDSRHPKSQVGKRLDQWGFVAMNFIISKEQIIHNQLSFDENFIGYGAEDHDYGFKLVDKNFDIIQGEQCIMHYEFGGDINKYANKIYHASRDGMKVMKKIYKDRVYIGKTKLRLIEYVFSSPILKSLGLYTLFSPIFRNFIIKFLLLTDKVKFYHFNFLYRYIILS
ncbi:glycosyltransferase, partial [Glaesserella parasuis]|nr:glycosyltransferase [Glaesserella parasuis]